MADNFKEPRIARDGFGSLLCPNCGGEYLHSTYVTVYDRHEDGMKTFETTVDEIELTRLPVLSIESKNPSLRRHGIAIGFFCEMCPESEDGEGPLLGVTTFELTLAQHKGTTQTRWRWVPK